METRAKLAASHRVGKGAIKRQADQRASSLEADARHIAVEMGHAFLVGQSAARK